MCRHPGGRPARPPSWICLDFGFCSISRKTIGDFFQIEHIKPLGFGGVDVPFGFMPSGLVLDIHLWA